MVAANLVDNTFDTKLRTNTLLRDLISMREKMIRNGSKGKMLGDNSFVFQQKITRTMQQKIYQWGEIEGYLLFSNFSSTLKLLVYILGFLSPHGGTFSLELGSLNWTTIF